MKKIIIYLFSLSLFTISTHLAMAAAQDDISSGLLTNMCISTYTSEPCGIGGEQ